MIAHRTVDLADHGRLEEISLGEPARPASAGQDLGPVAAGVLDQLGCLGQRLGLEHRADLDAFFQPIAHLELPGQLDGRLGELLRDRLVDVEPGGCDADLAVVAELADDGRLGDLRDIGVGEDDQGGMTAELEAEPLDAVGRAPDQVLAHFRRAGEADLPHGGMLEKKRGERPRRAHHQVGHAGRQAGVGQAGEHLEQGQRGLLGRPAHDRTAGGQRRRDLPARQGRGEVPGSDRPDDAHRVLDRVVPLGDVRGGDHPAVGALPLLGEPLEGVRGVEDLRLRLGQRFALLLGQRPGDRVGALAEELGRPLQDLGRS